MPEIGEIQRFERHDGGRKENKIWQVCEECGKGRWILKFQWDRGQCKICHHCYVMNHSIISKEGIHYEVKGANNPRWNGGRITNKDGYISVLLFPQDVFYPMGNKRSKDYNGRYVLEHRLVMAKALGRILDSKELVHHRNGIRGDNRLVNLELTSNKVHQKGYRIGYENGWREGIKYAQSL